MIGLQNKAEAQHFHLTVVKQCSGKPKENKCSRLNKIIQWNFIFNDTKKYSPSQLLYLLYLFSFFVSTFFPSKKTQQNKLHSFLHTIKSTKKQTSQVLFSNTYPHVSCTKLMIINVFLTHNHLKGVLSKPSGNHIVAKVIYPKYSKH